MDAREQALIDAIVASPDAETYSVYADFVMERGGAVGEIVAMMRGGTDKAVGEGRVREAFDVEARVDAFEAGLPTEVTLDVPDREAALGALEKLAGCPWFAVTRTVRLMVRSAVGAADIAAIEHRLAELGQPRMLEDLMIERAWEPRRAMERFVTANPPAPSWVQHRYSEELIAAFPRLGRGGIEAPRTLLRMLDALKVDTSRLQLPATRPGRELAMQPRELLAALLYGDGTGAVRRMVTGSCEVDAIDRFCVDALDALGNGPSHWANLVRLIGGPRTTRKLVELAARDPEAALAALEQIGSSLSLLERVRLQRAGMREEPYPAEVVARAGAEPREDLPAEIAARFAVLDNEVIAWLIDVGYTAKLREVIELFATSSRRERAVGLVWARVIAVPAESRIRRWLGATSLELEPCFVTAEGATDHQGRPMGVDLDTPLSLAHPGEMTDEQLATWLPVARPGQLDRELVAPRRPDLRLRELQIEPFPTQTQLLRIGFRIVNNLFTRYDSYRGVRFCINVDPIRGRVSAQSAIPPPPGLVHELARDLAAAARQEPR